MSVAFDPTEQIIAVNAELAGPSASARLRLALDTGSSNTLISSSRLIEVGVDLADGVAVSIVTPSGAQPAAFIDVFRLTSLGRTRVPFRVVAHEMPRDSAIDGLRGLDFLRGDRLTIDFRAATVELA